MTKALAFFDLDNTLLNAETKLDDEVVAALDQLRANDVEPVISSGRNIFEITEIMRKSKIDTVVSANGSYVINHGKPIYKAEFTDEQIERFSDYAGKHNNAFIELNDQTSRMNEFSEIAENAFNNVNSPVPLIDYNFYKTNPIYMMIVLTKQREDDERYKKKILVRTLPFIVIPHLAWTS